MEDGNGLLVNLLSSVYREIKGSITHLQNLWLVWHTYELI